MVYPIVKYGQPVLEKKAVEITEFDTPDLRKLVEDMFESMYGRRVWDWRRRRSGSASGSR